MSSKNETPAPKNDVADRLARLAVVEKRLADAEAEVSKLRDENERITSSGGLRYSPKDKPFTGEDGGYEFIVTPHPSAEDHDSGHLEPATVRACDESEAIRWYCQSHESKKGSQRAVDPVKVRITAKIVGRARADAIMRQRQISALRRKVETGNQLSEADQALLSECEDEVYGFRS